MIGYGIAQDREHRCVPLLADHSATSSVKVNLPNGERLALLYREGRYFYAATKDDVFGFVDAEKVVMA